MLAIAAKKYGPLEQLKNMELPTPEPQAGEVKIRVAASALNPADYKVILGIMKFLHGRNFPLVAGYDFSGTIEALGSGVADLKIGDEVFGFLPYGMANRQGAFAEIITAKRSELALKPGNVSPIQAAASATTGLTAMEAFRDLRGSKPSGIQVLITGVSGGVGSIAIPIAQRMGASVTAIGSGKGLELARRLGARTVIDRKNQNVFAEAAGPFDVIFDAAAAYRWGQWKKALKPGGVYVTTLPSLRFLIDKILSLFSSSTARFVMVKSKTDSLNQLAQWLADGLQVPLDSTIPVRNVAKGLARLQGGETLGKIAVEVSEQFGDWP